MRFDHVAIQVPSIAEAVDWFTTTIPTSVVRYRDDTWALLEAGGAKIAFVVADQHPDHLAWRVPDGDLDALAAAHGVAVSRHRDGSRSFYLTAPGGHAVEIIAYPERDASSG